MDRPSADRLPLGMAGSIPVSDALTRLEEQRRAQRRHGAGDRPALVVIDGQRYFFPESDAATRVMAAVRDAVALARAHGVPIFFARVVYDDLREVDPAWRARFDLSGLLRGRATAEMAPELEVTSDDHVVEKKHATVFGGTLRGGTSFADALSNEKIDTLVLVGATTSGCVRATAVDGAAGGYRVLVVEEAVFDPRLLSGPVALADMQDRYADIVSLPEAIDYVTSISEARSE